MNSRSLAVVMLAASIALGQQPLKKETPPKEPAKSKEPAKPAPGSLEDTLEKALRNSADIKAAEAKVRDAEAEVNRVRSQVLTKATALHSNLNVAKRMLTVAEELFARTKDGVTRGTIPQAEFLAAQSTVEKARGEVELLETELKSLRGEFAIKAMPHVAFDAEGRYLYTQTLNEALRVWDTQTGKLLENRNLLNDAAVKAAAVQTPMAERVRKILDREITFMANNLSLSEVFKELFVAAETDIPHRDLLGQTDTKFTLNGKMPLGAWFQALEDSDSEVAIVVRDYGLLMTSKDRVPKGAVGVSELWKAKETKSKDEPKAK